MDCGSFEELCDHLKMMFEDSVIEPSVSAKENHLMYSCALFIDNGRRRKTDVKNISQFLPLDFDHQITIEEIVCRLVELDVNFYIYSTTGHKLDLVDGKYEDNGSGEDRFRIGIELDRESSPEEFYKLWGGANSLFWNKADKQTKDATRLHIFPAQWSRHSFFEMELGKKPLSVDWLIAQCPGEIQDTFYDDVSYKDFDIQSDVIAELDNRSLVSERFIDEYQLASEGGRYFRFLCQVASKAKAQDISISSHDLHSIGDQMSRSGSNHKRRSIREAKRALSHVDRLGFEKRKKWVDKLSAKTKLRLIRKFKK